MIGRKKQRRNRGKKKICIERRYSTLGGKRKKKERMIGRKKQRRKMGEERDNDKAEETEEKIGGRKTYV